VEWVEWVVVEAAWVAEAMGGMGGGRGGGMGGGMGGGGMGGGM